ncbi:MAG: M28 family peptidase [Sphingomonas fennica]
MHRLIPLLLAVCTPALAADPAGGPLAFSIAEGLTTDVGPRLAGTEAEARARDWAVARLKALGFANVRIEPFQMPVWVRGAETAEIVAPAPQRIALTALGNSGATPADGLTAPVVGFDGLAALEAAPAEAVRGRIVFVDHRMGVTQDGSSYGYFGAIRRAGPSIAARKGAAAILIRSIGTDHHRLPHTGVQTWAAGVAPIPAAAVSVPDAEQIARLLAKGGPVTLRLTLTPRMTGTGTSGNVVAEVPGRDPKQGIVLVGGHLDSWDLGTGAIDDAAGLGITTAAARSLLGGRRPLRTVRLVWFGAEEVGGLGGAAYAKAHAAEPHALVAEADFGGDRVWQFSASAPATAAPFLTRLEAALGPLGIGRNPGPAHGGTDVAPAAAAFRTTIVDLKQDGTRYFDIHHTADDTLDKIDPTQLTQATEAWTAMLRLAADAPEMLARPE